MATDALPSLTMTPAAAAVRLGISKRQVQQLCQQEELEAWHDGPGSPWRIDAASVEAFHARRTGKPQVAAVSSGRDVKLRELIRLAADLQVRLAELLEE